MLTTSEKQEIIKKHRLQDNDTGSTPVQVALLTADVAKLTEHHKTHKHDHHSRRGLQAKVNRRRKLLDYLKRKDFTAYRQLIDTLGLRR